MPCNCAGYPEPEPDTHNGPAAEALCKILQDHEARGEMGCFDEVTLAWWVEHKRRDKARVEQDLRRARDDDARAKALAKLTPYEQSLLGLIGKFGEHQPSTTDPLLGIVKGEDK